MQNSPKIVPLDATSESFCPLALSLNPLQLAPDAGAIGTVGASSHSSAFRAFVAPTASTKAVVAQVVVPAGGRRAYACNAGTRCSGSRHSGSIATDTAMHECTACACACAHGHKQRRKVTHINSSANNVRFGWCNIGRLSTAKSRNATRRAQGDVLCAKIALCVVLSAFVAAIMLILLHDN